MIAEIPKLKKEIENLWIKYPATESHKGHNGALLEIQKKSDECLSFFNEWKDNPEGFFKKYPKEVRKFGFWLKDKDFWIGLRTREVITLMNEERVHLLVFRDWLLSEVFK